MVREQARRLALRARPFGVAVARGHELAHDLGRAQVAHQRLRAGVAEAAGEGAADLAADADGARGPAAVGDVDGLGLLAVAEAEQELAGLVRAGLHVGGLRAADDETLGQLGLQRAGDAGHGGEVGGALVVDPVPELLGPERLLADGGQLGRQFLARQAHQVAPSVGEQCGGGLNSADLARMRVRSSSVRSRGAHFGGHALEIAA